MIVFLLNIDKKKFDYIQGWILDFFGYYGREEKYRRNNGRKIKIEDFNTLAEKMLLVPFEIEDKNKKNHKR